MKCSVQNGIKNEFSAIPDHGETFPKKVSVSSAIPEQVFMSMSEYGNSTRNSFNYPDEN
jgi:hypothetical protein